MSFKIESYGMSNVGMKRFQNEDSYLINNEIGLYIVADGMGGHLGGEYASKLAVKTVEGWIEKFNGDPDATQITGVNTQDADIGDQLRYAIQEASRRIYQEAHANEKYQGMGTTTVATMLDGENLYIANVGDSRAYLVRDNEIKQLTEDHSLVSEQIKAGVISEADARGHKLKNIITRSVGYQEDVDTDITMHQVKTDDKILLCSDGLSNLVEDDEIRQVVGDNDLPEACEQLIKLANSRGGDDNITVIILHIDEDF
ncbi:MAG: Stp1/IreP family PP2C-type Ser/Thr phosphatase [Deltaproteobacteria bacterium]|nr:Stp1/IreP family PP2C-type Ser/Thr phosphatase [Deltaproteobacteria bacterium]